MVKRRVLLRRKDGKVQHYWVDTRKLKTYEKYRYPLDRRKNVYYNPEKIKERVKEVKPPEKKITGIKRVLHFSYSEKHPVYIDVVVTLPVENVEDIPKLEAYADEWALNYCLEQGFNVNLMTSKKMHTRMETEYIYNKEVEEKIEGTWRHE